MKLNHRKSLFAAALALFLGITVAACGGNQDDSATRGKANFHDRTLAGLGGNGRACADCHMDSESFQLTPGGRAGTVQRNDQLR